MVHDTYDRDSFRVVCFRICSHLSVKPYIVLDQQRDDSELFAHAFQKRPLLSFVMLPFQHVHYNYAYMYALLPPQDERLGLVRHGWLSTTSIVPCWWLFGFLFPWHASFCGSWFHIGIKFHDPQESKWEKPWVLPWSPGPPGKREKAWWKSKKCEKAFWFFCILCRFQSYVYIIVDTLI